MSARRALFTVLLALLTGACARSTQLSDVWVDDYWPGEPVGNFLVIGVTHQTEVRQAFEDQFVKDLHREGLEAVSSASVLGVGRIDSVAIVAYVEEHDIDAVLVSHLLKVSEERTYSPGATYAPASFSGGYYHYYSYGMNTVTTAGYMDQAEVVRLETNVYLRNHRLLWSGISDTFNPKSSDDIFKSLPVAVIDDMAQRGMIR
jgi:hypothetical protein